MAGRQHITHSFPPTYDANSQVLVLGTMPSPASRDLGFNYGHPRNRFWRVLAQLASEPVPATNDRKRDFCLRHHIALWDVLAECEIKGASDASIVNAKPNDLRLITGTAPIKAVFCTGAKSHELYRRLCQDEVGIEAVRLPSTSPANAACSMDRLLKEYAGIFEQVSEWQPPVLDVPAVVALEQAIAAASTPLSELMDRAGTAVAHRVQQLLCQGPERQPASGLVVVLCGNGNNGGDGWVVARLLAQEGVPVCVFTARMPEQLKAQPAHDAAVEALEVLQGLGAQVVSAAEAGGEALAATPLVVLDDGSEPCQELVERVMAKASVIVDALMGTGSSKAPRAPFDRWIAAANRAATAVRLAVDVPSGVDAQTGAVEDAHFAAHETITMMVRKPGLASPACGEVRVAPLAYLEPFLG